MLPPWSKVAFRPVLLLVGTGGNLSANTAQAYPAQDSTASVTEITQAPPPETAQEASAPAARSLADGQRHQGGVRADDQPVRTGSPGAAANHLRLDDKGHPPQVQGHRRDGCRRQRSACSGTRGARHPPARDSHLMR